MATNWYAEPGALTKQVFVDFADKAIEIIWNRRDQVEPQLARFFEKVPTTSETYKASSISSVVDLPIVSEDGSGVPKTQPAPGFDATYTTVNYRRGIWATDDMRRLDRFGKVKLMMSGLLKASVRLHEYAYASILDLAFTSTTTADAQYLCSSTHNAEDPRAGTQSNLTTAGALTPTRFSAMRVAMRQRKGEKGDPDPRKMTALLVDNDNEEMGSKILGTDKLPDSAVNDENWNKDFVELIVSDWLTGTGWFGIGDSDGEQKGLWHLERVAPNIIPALDPNNDPDVIWGRRLKEAFTVCAHDWRNIQGNAGA